MNNQHPKILFIFQLPPPIHGASMINKMIYDSQLINSSFYCSYINLTTAKDVKDIGKNGFRKYWRSLKIYIKVISKVTFNNFDIVYLTLSPHGIAFYKDGILAVILKLFRCKLVFHLHGKGIDSISKKSKVKRLIYQLVFKGVKVIHLSELLYFDIKQFVEKENVWYLPNGIDYSRHIREEIPPKNILYLSNMQESKGSFELLKAAKILKDRKLNFHINFVGKWHNDNSFKERWLSYYNNNNLQEKVSYLGPMYGSDKINMFKNAFCFVLPTVNDCFPISILEAMSYGLPVVSTDEGAISELIVDKKTGYIIEKNNPERLANVLESMLINIDITSQLGLNAQKIFYKKYTIEIFESNFCRIMNEILNKGYC